LTACGGSTSSNFVATATPTPGATVAPTPTPAGPTGATSTSFVISLNGGGETILAKHRSPQFVSPSTQSITFSVDGKSATAQNLSASATNCANANGGVRCTIPLTNVAAGAHTLSLTAWSGANGTGNKLGANSSIGFTVVANQANTVSGVIGGIATGINLVPTSGATGSMAQGFTLVASTQPSAFTANPVDASGNAIVGPGAPTITATMNNGSATATAGAAPNTFTISVAAGDTLPLLTNLGQLTAQLTPVANSGGSPLSVTVGISSKQPRIYVVGANQVVSYDEFGNVQTTPGSGNSINTSVNKAIAIAWDPTSSMLVGINPVSSQSYVFTGDNIANFLVQGAVVPAPGVLAWNDADQVAYEYDTASSKLAQIGPWPNPTAITLLGSATASPYTALAWSGSPPGGGQQQDYLYAATSNSVLDLSITGAVNATLTPPNVGNITGLAYDPATQKLFVAGTTGVASYTYSSLNASPGFTGVTGATGIAVNPLNSLVYVAESSSKIVAFNEAGVQQFSFSTGTLVPQQIIAVP
jgi:hypothetical protein